MHKKIKLPLVLFLLTFVISSLLVGCGSKNTAASPSQKDEKKDNLKIKIADINTNPTFRTAINKGFFAKYGIEAELFNFATPAEGINSLFIKQVDVAFGAEFPILNAVSKGDYAIIASPTEGSAQSAALWKLYVRDGIQNPEDLKGKKVSNFRGTFVSYLWDTFLAEHQLSLKDVTVIGQGGFDEAFVALKKGDIDAAWVSGSTLHDKFKALEGVHELTDMSKTKVRIGMGLIAPNSLIKEHPDGVANFLKALDEASVYIQANKEEVADMMFKEVKLPKDAVLRDLPINVWSIGFSQAAYDSFAKQKKYMVETGIIKNDFDLASKINTDSLKKVFPDRIKYSK